MRVVNSALRGIAAGLTVMAAFCVPPAMAQPPAPAAVAKDFASSTEIKAQVKAMLAEMKLDQGFMWRPVVRQGATVAAIEIWKKPGRPAIHPADAEYAIVLQGKGTLLSGGTMADQVFKRPELVEGSRIEGGVTRTLSAGDVILIPAGAPHWFGVEGGELILLGVKIPVAR